MLTWIAIMFLAASPGAPSDRPFDEAAPLGTTPADQVDAAPASPPPATEPPEGRKYQVPAAENSATENPPPPSASIMGDAVAYSIEDLDIDYQDTFGNLPDREKWIWDQAQVTLDVGDYNQAEKHLNQFLVTTNDEEAKRLALLTFIQKYHQSGMRMKLVFFLENFTNQFTDDPHLPVIYLYLGQLYTELGSMESARKHYYNVLHLALHFSYTQSMNYQRLSREAKWGIANTYFIAGDYEDAIRFFERLTRYELSPDSLAMTYAKIAECYFLQEKYSRVVSTLSTFAKEGSQLSLPPFVHYYLAKSYWHLGQQQESVEEVITLLERVADTKNSSHQEWLYWKERTGNHMASSFLREGDYFSALKIYQTMAPLDDKGGWQIPIVYHIAVCFENLQMNPKALQAYQYIVEFPEEKLLEENADIETIQVIREAAAWKINHLKSRRELNEKIISLELDPFTQESPTS